MRAVTTRGKVEKPVEETNSEPKKQLAELIPQYDEHNTQKKVHEKEVSNLGGQIKGIMVENDIKEFSINGVKATCSISERVNFNQDILLELVREMGVEGVIKTREYLDMEALESAIYHGEIDATKLAKAQVTNEVITLRVNKEKKSAK